MRFIPTPLPGVILIEIDTFADPRGYFMETYHQKKYAEGGIAGPFVQDNFSKSSKGTLRGLHAQMTHPQAKLVHIVAGEIWDVAVDVRPGSAHYKEWYGVRLSSEQHRQLYIPVGFAHGFCVLSESALVEYKCTDVYDASNELHLLWNDPTLAIDWPIQNPVLSSKDAAGATLHNVEAQLLRSFSISG